MNIDEARKRAQELGELAAADPEFRKRAESDPRGTMIEHGIPEALVDDILNKARRRGIHPFQYHLLCSHHDNELRENYRRRHHAGVERRKRMRRKHKTAMAEATGKCI